MRELVSDLQYWHQSNCLVCTWCKLTNVAESLVRSGLVSDDPDADLRCALPNSEPYWDSKCSTSGSGPSMNIAGADGSGMAATTIFRMLGNSWSVS
jgi:hypothetical protein